MRQLFLACAVWALEVRGGAIRSAHPRGWRRHAGARGGRVMRGGVREAQMPTLPRFCFGMWGVRLTGASHRGRPGHPKGRRGLHSGGHECLTSERGPACHAVNAQQTEALTAAGSGKQGLETGTGFCRGRKGGPAQPGAAFFAGFSPPHSPPLRLCPQPHTLPSCPAIPTPCSFLAKQS